MTYAPGERERAELFYEQRAARIATRVALEEAMLAPADPFVLLMAQYSALLEPVPPAEDEFPDSDVVKNHNIW